MILCAPAFCAPRIARSKTGSSPTRPEGTRPEFLSQNDSSMIVPGRISGRPEFGPLRAAPIRATSPTQMTPTAAQKRARTLRISASVSPAVPPKAYHFRKEHVSTFDKFRYFPG